jgi:cysteine synthase A
MSIAFTRVNPGFAELMKKLTAIAGLVGDTPVRKLKCGSAELYVKLEYLNYSGSIKDRAVLNILSKAISKGEINRRSTVIESSSGNFAISLASICRSLGIRSVTVIDPNINPDYEKALHLLSSEVVKVNVRDKTGGFLLTRLDKVRELCEATPHAFWTDQYSNPDNYLAYYNGLAPEIIQSFPRLDYVFIGVSTCGTLAGISRRLKEHYPGIKIIAVDIRGSIIFGHQPEKRHISGLGSSLVPPQLSYALIDDVVMLSESDIVRGAFSLLEEQAIFGGASAGAMYYAASRFFDRSRHRRKPVVLFLCPDKGNAYLDTIYNLSWVRTHIDPDFSIS